MGAVRARREPSGGQRAICMVRLRHHAYATGYALVASICKFVVLWDDYVEDRTQYCRTFEEAVQQAKDVKGNGYDPSIYKEVEGWDA